MGLQHYTQDMSKIPLKYHINVLFYTKYTHPTLICRRTHGRTDARTENIYSIFRDKLLLLGEHGHVAPLKPQHCLYLPNPIKYGKDNQAPSPLDDSPLLDEAGKKRAQQIVGSFLYYAWAVDPTILMALSEMSSQ